MNKINVPLSHRCWSAKLQKAHWYDMGAHVSRPRTEAGGDLILLSVGLLRQRVTWSDSGPCLFKYQFDSTAYPHARTPAHTHTQTHTRTYAGPHTHKPTNATPVNTGTHTCTHGVRAHAHCNWRGTFPHYSPNRISRRRETDVLEE